MRWGLLEHRRTGVHMLQAETKSSHFNDVMLENMSEIKWDCTLLQLSISGLVSTGEV